MALIIIPVIVLMPWGHLTNGHLWPHDARADLLGIHASASHRLHAHGMGVFFACCYTASIRRPRTGGCSTCSCSAPTA